VGQDTGDRASGPKGKQDEGNRPIPRKGREDRLGEFLWGVKKAGRAFENMAHVGEKLEGSKRTWSNEHGLLVKLEDRSPKSNYRGGTKKMTSLSIRAGGFTRSRATSPEGGYSTEVKLG